MKILLPLYLTSLFILGAGTVSAETLEAPHTLRVDYLVEPLGLDNPEPRLSWVVGDQRRGAVQSAYRILVASTPARLLPGQADVWDSGKVPSDATFQIPVGGPALESATRYYWTVRTWDGADRPSAWSAATWFETGLLNPTDWKGEWIGDGSEPPETPEGFYERIPAPLLRKEFSARGEVARARLYISGLGYYEARLNGEKVGDHWLDPGWTQYGDAVYYAVYDVTDRVQAGANALGVMLGNGWYNPLPMDLFGRWNLREILTIGRPKVRAQLHLHYADGSSEVVATDPSWRTAEGPVVRNNVYLGEWYDARLEQPGWDEPAFGARGWAPAVPADAPGGELRWQHIPPIRHTRTVTPVSMHRTEDGKYIYDLGQNFAGVIRFKTQAPAGTEVVFRYAELLYPDGTLDVRTSVATQIKKEFTINGGPGAPETAWQEDRYFCKGGGAPEVFQPRFTFHGFRYVEVSGLPETPSLNDLEGLRLNADLPDHGDFRCSDGLFNTLQDVTEWTMLSNVFSIQSDCPAREKFAYGGDIVTAGEAYIRYFGMEQFYLKTARDFARDALPSGAMTACAPNIGINGRGVVEDTGAVGWVLAHPFAVEQLYDYYGRTDAVAEQYEAHKALVEFFRRHVPDHIIMDGIGDHVSVDERPRPVTSTAFYYDHARMLAKFARILGKEEDAAEYGRLAEEIKQAFIDKFVNLETGEVFTRTQACQVFALYYGLLPEGLENKAVDVLLEEIYLKHKGHLSTGIFATKMMLQWLNENGMNRTAWDILSKKEYPGFGYMIDNGATTLWENWHNSLHDSKNHPMFGSVTEWFSEAVLGIRQASDSVGFASIVIEPALVGDLTWAEGHYDSVRGRIGSHWWKWGDALFLEVEIPANTRAEIRLPLARGHPRATITEGSSVLVQDGEAVAHAGAEVRMIGRTRDVYRLEAGAGRYRFKVE